jgi:hypothetical protein
MPAFQIIYGHKETPKEQWAIYSHRAGYDPIEDVPIRVEEWDNPQEPNEIVKKQNAASKLYRYDTCYMLQRLPDAVDYEARENARPDYVPFEVQGKTFHCAELKGTEISFYATRFDAYDDKRTTMKVGRYLRAHTTKHDNEISEICAKYGVEAGDCALKWARTREEIREVYRTGPRSCMKGDPGEFGCGYEVGTDPGYSPMPVEAYASPDIAIAYLERDDRVTARTVVSLKHKEWISIYGDTARLTELLTAEGYTRRTDGFGLRDCRLLKIDCGDRWAVPYLDDGYVTAADMDDPQYLILSAGRGGWASEEGYVLKSAASCSHQTDGWEEEEEYDDGDYY